MRGKTTKEEEKEGEEAYVFLHVDATEFNVGEVKRFYEQRVDWLLRDGGWKIFSVVFSRQNPISSTGPFLLPDQWLKHMRRKSPEKRAQYAQSWEEFHAVALASEQLRMELGLLPQGFCRIDDNELGDNFAQHALENHQNDDVWFLSLPVAPDYKIAKTKTRRIISLMSWVAVCYGSSKEKAEPLSFCFNCVKLVMRNDLCDILKHCAGCQRATYCSAECQKENWPLHKKMCKIDVKKIVNC